MSLIRNYAKLTPVAFKKKVLLFKEHFIFLTGNVCIENLSLERKILPDRLYRLVCYLEIRLNS